MAKDTWKSFEKNLLTHSAAHYLMAIRELTDEVGYARVTDVARRLNITRGSCSISLKTLKKRGLVEEDHNRFLLLSDEGQRLAGIVQINDKLLESLLRDVLGVDEEQAEVDACKIEHLISIETSVRLDSLIRYLNSGRPSVDAFLRDLNEYISETCDQGVESCEFCRETCLRRARKLES